ncbi:MAG: hypothetical protein H6837_06615 [Planctomycetes bacterium]|nr:hypothetical protein [Planctomycetota bacterium]
MAARDDLIALQGVLGRLLTERDPAAALAECDVLPVELAALLEHIDPDGLRIARLLVARLRFERLMNGSDTARSWFADDPAGFSAAFHDYHADVPPTAFHPWDEAMAFASWQATRC